MLKSQTITHLGVELKSGAQKRNLYSVPFMVFLFICITTFININGMIMLQDSDYFKIPKEKIGTASVDLFFYPMPFAMVSAIIMGYVFNIYGRRIPLLLSSLVASIGTLHSAKLQHAFVCHHHHELLHFHSDSSTFNKWLCWRKFQREGLFYKIFRKPYWLRICFWSSLSSSKKIRHKRANANHRCAPIYDVVPNLVFCFRASSVWTEPDERTTFGRGHGELLNARVKQNLWWDYALKSLTGKAKCENDNSSNLLGNKREQYHRHLPDRGHYHQSSYDSFEQRNLTVATWLRQQRRPSKQRGGLKYVLQVATIWRLHCGLSRLPYRLHERRSTPNCSDYLRISV